MKDILKKRIDTFLMAMKQEELNEDIWEAVDKYLLDDIDQTALYFRIMALLHNDNNSADVILWVISDFINAAM